MNDPLNNYRSSHAAEGYGQHYSRTYESGYYAHLWRTVERPILEKVFQQLRAAGKRSCLDFACGTGRITAVAEQYFEPMVGVDVSEQMLTVARQRCRSSVLQQRDITTTPLEHKFDVVTAFRFYLNAESQLRKDALAAMSAALAPAGCLLINVHVNSSSLLGRVYRLRNRLKRRTVANTASLQDVLSSIREAGLDVGQVLWYGCYPRTGWRFDWLTSHLLGPAELLYQRSSWIPRHWAQSFIAVCSRRGQPTTQLVMPRVQRKPTGELAWVS